MVVEQSGKSIKIQRDNYVKDVVAEYAEYINKALRPKKVPISPGVAFKARFSRARLSRSTTAHLWHQLAAI